MSLKSVSMLCGVLMLLSVLAAVGGNVYSLITLEYYPVSAFALNVPHWLAHTCIAAFFFMFSRRI